MSAVECLKTRKIQTMEEMLAEDPMVFANPAWTEEEEKAYRERLMKNSSIDLMAAAEDIASDESDEDDEDEDEDEE